MRKRISIIFLSIIFLCTLNIKIYGEETIDMSEWKFVQIESNGVNTISRLYSKYNSNKYAFCVEPNQSFNKNLTYYKKICDDDYIYNLVKTYDTYGINIDNESNNYNYYISCQILIWEYLTNNSYDFNKDYREYKTDLLNHMNMSQAPKVLLNQNNDNLIKSNVNEIITIEEDLSDFDINADEGIEIISNNNNKLVYKITDNSEDIKQIEFISKNNTKDQAYIYYSENGQDIYCFEGNYNETKRKTLLVKANKTEHEYFDINYSKRDTNGIPIEGAEFTLYELGDDIYDEKLIFINTNTDIDIYEVCLDDYSLYDDLSLQISERYSSYLNGNTINTDEIGYFSYKIFNHKQLIDEGKIYVSDDCTQTDNLYSKNNVLSVFKGYSEAKPINTISSLKKDKKYYLCESEPKKGYIYTHNACKLIAPDTYSGEVIEFVNENRTYTLKLMKQSPYDIPLDGAIFKISYFDENALKDIILTTGYLNVQRENDNKYLVYRLENEIDAHIVEFIDSYYSTKVNKNGKYYYYQTNSNIIDESLLNNQFIFVTTGGFLIQDLPYSSSLTIEELKAPEGFMITDPIYYISPNISYSEITFHNFRINEFDILAKKKFKVPKTCIENLFY